MLRRDPAAEFRNRGVERLPYGLGRRTCRRLRVWLADKGFAQRQWPQVSPSQQTANHIEYGGFQIPPIPSYVGLTGRLWLEQGNAYVVANLRGGGEFGPQWHQTAQGATKQRTWDDFIAVAEDLIRRKITSPRRMGVVGGSQGGLLVGTAITQQPELFNAAILQVPLLDMVRFTKLGAGASWIGEYGDPTIPEQRKWLEGYSPCQRLVPGKTYPAPSFSRPPRTIACVQRMAATQRRGSLRWANRTSTMRIPTGGIAPPPTSLNRHADRFRIYLCIPAACR
ncbi:prolyl oligopeptidase family serine peptidase [Bradyrhizobium agreste]|uniref:prolyl oligopeptidase family serine peptidase n=1 Tax=Bradyrhizobium agreste TaxID=2751811 RepID=UPI001FEBC96A|nr:prolyl oligopeptidase family serine peptidase [Bradyrhizobium agreste]